MKNYKLSQLAENLGPLAINDLSEIINEKIQQGEVIYNLTQGDFSPKIFPIPADLEKEIIKAYQEKHTNYPVVGGAKELLKAISKHIKLRGDFEYDQDEIVVASGVRPLICILFKTILDPKDKAIYTAPSWNTQHFLKLSDATTTLIEAKAENNFLITANEIKPHIKDAVVINLNSPLNPCGTAFDSKNLKEIFDLIVEENLSREKNNQKPLYVLFDIIYWLMIYNSDKYDNPLLLNERMKDYTIFVDGISKCFAATGVRLGWAFGPKPIIQKMRSILAHLGSWSPKPEQIGTARFLEQTDKVTSFLTKFKQEILDRLNIFYEAIKELKQDGYKVDTIKPQGAIYLSIKLDLIGAKTKDGKTLKTPNDIQKYFLDVAKVAIVPFHAFGTKKDLPWFRISVGTCSIESAKKAADKIRDFTKSLNY